MPLSRTIAKLNRSGFNRLSAKFAGRLPPFAIIHHVGRNSGKPYATPIMVFRKGDCWVFALTYGPETDWVKNVTAAGGCEIEYRGQRFNLVEPKLIDADAARPFIPAPIRMMLKIMRITHYFELRLQ